MFSLTYHKLDTDSAMGYVLRVDAAVGRVEVAELAAADAPLPAYRMTAAYRAEFTALVLRLLEHQTFQADPYLIGNPDDTQMRKLVIESRGELCHWEWQGTCSVPLLFELIDHLENFGRAVLDVPGWMPNQYVEGVWDGRGGKCHRTAG
jgi:hypothetical protein